MDLSGDTAVIGAFGADSGESKGAAYVFVQDSNGTWVEQAKLTASDGAAADFFGTSVAISGNSIVVGAWLDDDKGADSGSAYVFVRDSNSAWSQQHKLAASDGAASDQFGVSVAISGNTAVVGAYLNDDQGTNSGSAYVFVRDTNGTWSQKTNLTANDGTPFSQFGQSVDLSGDTAVIGAFRADSGESKGAAYVFVRDSNGA